MKQRKDEGGKVFGFFRPKKSIGVISTLGLVAANQCLMALEIDVDYTYDDATDGFFSSNAAAKAALEKAASDVSALITSELRSVNGGTYNGTGGNPPFTSTANFDWNYLFKNPSTGVDTSIETPTLAADTITVFAGVTEHTGNTLGRGGPSGAGFTFGGSGFASSWAAAVADAEAKSNFEMSRGAGPIVNTYSSSSTLGSTTAFYNLGVGIGVGTLSMDVDTDNDGFTDGTALLNNFWHFDHTTPVASGKYDFYSVALHELLHAIGFGVSETWDNFVSNGTDWTGPEVLALVNGTNLIDGGGGHIALNTFSPRLSDGVLQEVSLSPAITPGVRRELTELDAAFLRDLGYTTVPEPSTAMLLCGILGIGLMRRR